MTKVLIVDDRHENRHLLNVLLKSGGYAAEEAADGAEALASARANPPDLVISDLMMPVMDGYALLREWKNDSRLRPIPFVVYTATYTGPEDERLALDLGADAFIIKPMEPQPFLDRIHAVLEADRAGRLRPPRQPAAADQILLKEYNTVLVRKLEEKAVELQAANRALERDVEALRRIEVDLKQAEEALRLANAQTHAYAARLQEIREEERAGIAREIHDVLAQELTRLKLDMAWFDRRLAGPVDATVRETLRERLREVNALLDASIRTVQKIATELRPVILDNLGLYAAIEWLAGDFAARTGIKCRARVPGRQASISRDQATAFFRVLQECLTNISRHANATEVEAVMSEADAELVLTVTDNGKGIAPEALNDLRSIGLLGMRERAMAFGGRVEIGPAPGAGTRVIARIPLAKG